MHLMVFQAGRATRTGSHGVGARLLTGHVRTTGRVRAYAAGHVTACTQAIAPHT